MAQQKKPTQEGTIKATVKTNGEEHIGFEPVKQIEEETLTTIKSIKTFVLSFLRELRRLPLIVLKYIMHFDQKQTLRCSMQYQYVEKMQILAL